MKKQEERAERRAAVMVGTDADIIGLLDMYQYFSTAFLWQIFEFNRNRPTLLVSVIIPLFATISFVELKDWSKNISSFCFLSNATKDWMNQISNNTVVPVLFLYQKFLT